MTAENRLAFLEKVLTPRRLEHSLGVMQVMGDLATVYDLDMDQAETSGILHDAAKDLGLEEQAKLIAEAGIEFYDDCDRNYLLYLHGPVGAALVRRELEIHDPLILAAIESHTSYGISPYFDHPLCWCLRFADVLEPARAWHKEVFMREKVSKLAALVYGGRMAEAVVYQTGMLMRWFEQKGFPIHPNMQAANQRFAVQAREVF